MSSLELEMRRAAMTYVCHVKAEDLQVDFAQLWQSISPGEPVPDVPQWPVGTSKDLLSGMRSSNDFVEALCIKYEVS